MMLALRGIRMQNGQVLKLTTWFGTVVMSHPIPFLLLSFSFLLLQCSEVTLCGWQDIKIQLLLLLLLLLLQIEIEAKLILVCLVQMSGLENSLCYLVAASRLLKPFQLITVVFVKVLWLDHCCIFIFLFCLEVVHLYGSWARMVLVDTVKRLFYF